jgi:CubicO group peptidase (beta-lactamase class C family)
MNSKLSSKFLYNNAMYAVAGEAAANVMGISYEDVVREKVIQPLNLANTGFSQTEMKKCSNHASGFSASSLQDAQKGNFKSVGLDETYMACAPAADMYSNVQDMVKWGRTVVKLGELDGKQVLDRKSVETTLTAHTIVPGPRRMPELALVWTYGLGWGLDSFKGHAFYHHSKELSCNMLLRAGHRTSPIFCLVYSNGIIVRSTTCTAGATGGFSSSLILFPDEDLVIAQLFNIRHSELSPCIAYYVADKILGLPTTKDWLFDVAIRSTEEAYEALEKRRIGNLPEHVFNKHPSHSLDVYVGEYSHPVFGRFSVRLENDMKEEKPEGLVFDLWTFEGRLEHYHFDHFVLRLVSMSINQPYLAMFQTGADGKVASILLDSHGGQIEFKRMDVPGTDRS